MRSLSSSISTVPPNYSHRGHSYSHRGQRLKVHEGVMEDNYSNMWSQEVDMDLDMGVGVSEVEEAIMDFNENEEVDCSESF